MKIDDILKRFPYYPEPLPPPPYYSPFPYSDYRPNLALAVESMRYHMTDEGWQIMLALYENGYRLAGYKCPINETDVSKILGTVNPLTLVIQDKREWMGLTADRSRNLAMRFRNVETLRDYDDIFKVTILKDAHHDSALHQEAAGEIGMHAWICYYSPRIVARLAPYVREQHLIRTYHTVDRDLVPRYSPEGRGGALLSGAMSSVYPLRLQVRNLVVKGFLPNVTYLKHPGYYKKGCKTPEFLKTLSSYKVSICTSSIYGYALRKIIESTACGCRVITDLPEDDILPGIDGNLIRVSGDLSHKEIAAVIDEAISGYDPEQQGVYSRLALECYDYRIEGARLVRSIESLRRTYHA